MVVLDALLVGQAVQLLDAHALEFADSQVGALGLLVALLGLGLELLIGLGGTVILRRTAGRVGVHGAVIGRALRLLRGGLGCGGCYSFFARGSGTVLVVGALAAAAAAG